MPTRRICLALLAGAFVASRLLCFAAGVRFDAKPLDFYLQYLDPALLRNDFWRSIFYLEQQPPAFNLFLGAILHLFPAHPQIGFHLIYLGLGLALSLSLFELMDRIGVSRGIALAIALVFTLSPSTILYENLLFYEYPLAALFSVAALFLHRFATDGRLRDGVVFFGCAALIGGIRSIFHFVWFCAVALFLVWAMREWRKRVVLAGAAPGLLLAAFYGKHFLTFRNFFPGGSYSGMTAAVMMTSHIPRAALEALIASGKITPVLRADILYFGEDFNANPSDSYPGAYLTHLWGNVKRYFWPATREWPFDGRKDDANQRILARPLALYNLFTAASWPPAIGPPWLTYLLLPGLLGFGLFQALSAFRGTGANQRACGITLAFLVGNAYTCPRLSRCFRSGSKIATAAKWRLTSRSCSDLH